MFKLSGVDLPTHAASLQCDLLIPNRFRLNLVKPPLPVSTGKPLDSRTSLSFPRVALTAAVSANGSFLCLSINANSLGLSDRKSAGN